MVPRYDLRVTLKHRLSASVDADLIDAGRKAVEAGEADSLSAWVNDALRRQADRDRRLAALDVFLNAYESEHGEITDAEIAAATRRARARALAIRDKPATGRPARREA